MEFFLRNKRKKVAKPAIHQNSSISKALPGKFLESLIINIDFNPENYRIPRRHRLSTTKQTITQL